MPRVNSISVIHVADKWLGTTMREIYRSSILKIKQNVHSRIRELAPCLYIFYNRPSQSPGVSKPRHLILGPAIKVDYYSTRFAAGFDITYSCVIAVFVLNFFKCGGTNL